MVLGTQVRSGRGRARSELFLESEIRCVRQGDTLFVGRGEGSVPRKQGSGRISWAAACSGLQYRSVRVLVA